MSFLDAMRKRRRDMKLEVKAATAKAKEAAKHEAKLKRETKKAESKAAAKQAKRDQKMMEKAASMDVKQAKKELKKQQKLDDRASKRMVKIHKGETKTERKALAAKQKHQTAMAAKILEQQRAQGFTADKAKNWVAAARMIIPVALPLAYRGIAFLQNRELNAKAQQYGVTGAESARFYGHGAGLRARIGKIRTALDDLERSNKSGTSGFVKDAKKRLEVLDDSVETAERMTPDQRRRTHKSITAELNKLDGEIVEMIGK